MAFMILFRAMKVHQHRQQPQIRGKIHRSRVHRKAADQLAQRTQRTCAQNQQWAVYERRSHAGPEFRAFDIAFDELPWPLETQEEQDATRASFSTTPWR
jgi:hypothetical protein